jgi:hypothetical protein
MSGMGSKTRRIRWLAIGLLAMGWLATLSSGCGVHPGGDALAFVRGGQLWTIQADGSDAHRIANGDIIGFAWSPDHHQLVFRTTTQQEVAAPSTPLAAAPDALGDLYVTSINGGSPVQISQSLGLLARSDAWWNPDGNRLLYRENIPLVSGRPGPLSYIESQADQPLGIASKTLQGVASLPVLAADGSRVAVIDPDGNVRVGPPETLGSVVASGVLLMLPGSSRPGRVLWQPHHNALLYATAATAASAGVAVVLRDLRGGARTLVTVPVLLDAAFSPDGSRMLVRTPQDFSLWNIAQTSAPLFSWPESDPSAIAFWSPDGRAVLVDDASGSQLISIARRTVTPLLAFATQINPHATQPPLLWHPATCSPWSPDGTRIVFVAANDDTWHGSALPKLSSGTRGLYMGTINSDGTPGAARLIDPQGDAAPSWSYADPSSTFLLPSG